MSSKDHARADDPQRQNELRKEENLQELQSYLDVRFVMQSAQGRRTLHNILTKLGAGVVMRGDPLAFGPGGLDTNTTLVNLGKQIVGEELKFAWAVACPEEFIEMMSEQVRDLAISHEHLMRKKREYERRHNRGEEESDAQKS